MFFFVFPGGGGEGKSLARDLRGEIAARVLQVLNI